MKKLLIRILILVLVVSLAGPVTQQLELIRENNKIEDSKPSSEEAAQLNELLNDNTYYYYNSLSQKEQTAYLVMYSSFLSFDDNITMEITSDSLKDVFTAVLYDNPNIFWVNNDYQYVENDNSVTFTPTYRNSYDEAQRISDEMQTVVSRLVREAQTLESDYEKELYFHDYICENTVYDDSRSLEHNDSAYSVFCKGTAICEGYSRAMQMLLDEADIDNFLVTGDAESEGETAPHMWNVVVLDGISYHLDVTWDDSGEDNTTVYFYFNVSSSMIGADHYNIEPENVFCVSDLHYYYNVEESYIESFSGFGSLVNHSVEILKSGENRIELVFKNSEDFTKALSCIENDRGFFDYVCSSVKKSGRALNPYKITYYTIETRNYLCIEIGQE